MTRQEIQDKLWNDYFYEGTNVLKNKLDIHDKQLLSQKEIELSFLRQIELLENPIAIKFDISDLKAIHEYLFQDVYDFAGKFRNVDIEKNACPFVPCEVIESRLQMELKLMEEDEKNIHSKMDFASHLAKYFASLMYIHPFREGNGRSIREFIREYACEKSKNYSFGPLEFLWSKVNGKVLDDSIHFSLAFRSAIELEFLNALVPCDNDLHL